MNETSENKKDKQPIKDQEQEENRADGKRRFVANGSREENLVDRVSELQKLFNQKTIPAEVSTFAIRVAGPLTDTTRRHKKLLLGLCLVGILMMKTGLVPGKVSALGIEFTKADQGAILLITAMCVGYFLVGFAISVICDLFAWFHSMSASEWVIFPQMRKIYNPKSFSTILITIVRFSYEIILPLFLGCYSLKLLWDPSMKALAFFF